MADRRVKTKRYVEDPVKRALDRTSQKEPEGLSEDDLEALEEAHQDLAAGRVRSHEEVWRRLRDEE